VILLERWPEVAAVDCLVCQKIQHDDNWRPIMQAGQPVPRPSGIKPPCGYPHIGCPKGTPEQSRALTTENMQAYRFHKECEAVQQWPEDAVVRRNAAVIRSAESVVRRWREQETAALLKAFLGVTANVR